MMRFRTVFWVEPYIKTRFPIAEITADREGALRVVAIPHHLGGDVEHIIALVVKDLAEITDLNAPTPKACGLQAVWGELVRVRYADGSFEDLDERQMVASEGTDRLPGESPWGTLVTCRLMDRGTGEYVERVYFYAGPMGLPTAPVSEFRGASALLEPRDGGPLWARVVVESWEEVARRQRHDAEHMALTLRHWAKNERELADQPPSAEKAAVHEAAKTASSNTLHMIADKIERILSPVERSIK